MKSDLTIDVLKPKSQLKLYGYEYYFSFFDNLYTKNKLPNSLIVSGQKGIGKSTFIYHFVNFLLSKKDKYKYNREEFLINDNSSIYKLIQNETHSNFFY